MSSGDIRERHASPYPGLRPFRQDEAELFFGRGEQVEAMLTKLETHRFLAVVGASGCGKSSLVRAGLLPALDEGYLSEAPPPWLIIDLRPGDAPLDRLAEALLKAQPRQDDASPPVEHAQAMLTATLRRGPLGLVDALRESRVPGDTNVLLLVDQFEELFRFRRRVHGKSTATETQRNEAAAFVELLLQTARQTARPVYVVLTTRSDFLGDCDAFLGLPEAVNDGQFLAPRLTRDQLAEVIRRPAQLFGARIDEPLVNRLLNQLGNDPDQLPVLQHALMRMWTRKQAALTSQSGTLSLTAEDYALTGGLEDALSQHADEAYNSLDATGQRIAERMFRCLSDGGPEARLTRRLAKVQEIADVAQVSVDDVIGVTDVFRRPDRCFLSPPANVPLTAQSTLDISHESLLRLWRRMPDWVRAEAISRERYRDLCRRADQHQSGGDLLGRQDLNRYQTWFDREQPTSAWAARYGGSFESAVALLRKSADAIAKEDEQQRRAEATKRRSVIAALCVLAAFTAILFVFWQMASRAAVAAKEKDWEGRLLFANSESERARYARSASLHMWLCDKLASDDVRRGGLTKFIGSECYRLGTCLAHDAQVFDVEFSSDGALVLTEAMEAGEARTWLAATGKPLSAPMRHNGPINDIAFSPDGSLVATASRDDTARIWDSRTGTALAELRHERDVNQVAFSATGNEIATSCEDGLLRIWNPRSGKMIGRVVDQGGLAWCIVAHPNESLFAVACSDGNVRLIDVQSAEHATRTLKQPSPPNIMAFNVDGRFLAVGCLDGTAIAWDVRAGKPLWERPVRHNAIVVSIGFSSDGKMIATGSNDTTARVCEAETGRAIGELMKHGGGVRGVVFLEHDQWLLTGNLDGGIRVWDYRTGRQLTTPVRHQGPVYNLVASPNQEVILSASGDYTARIWKREGQLKDQFALPCRDIARTAAFSPSGRFLLTGHNDNTAIVWDATNWRAIQELPHKEFVNRVAFGPNDATAVTGSRDQKIKIWDLRGPGAPVKELPLPSWPSSMRASPNRCTLCYQPRLILAFVAVFDEGITESPDGRHRNRRGRRLPTGSGFLRTPKTRKATHRDCC
jgi:WD40 repeat protein/energy-coupling factor transporter ATP-binding protein EcfA2